MQNIIIYQSVDTGYLPVENNFHSFFSKIKENYLQMNLLQNTRQNRTKYLVGLTKLQLMI